MYRTRENATSLSIDRLVSLRQGCVNGARSRTLAKVRQIVTFGKLAPIKSQSFCSISTGWAWQVLDSLWSQGQSVHAPDMQVL